MVEVVAGRQRRSAFLLEQRHPLLAGVQKHLAVILAINGHAEHVGIELLRALHVVDVQYDMVDPTGLDHRLRLPLSPTITLPSAKRTLGDCAPAPKLGIGSGFGMTMSSEDWPTEPGAADGSADDRSVPIASSRWS